MFLCFRALSTQQGGYVHATNLYYYYYYYIRYNLGSIKQHNDTLILIDG